MADRQKAKIKGRIVRYQNEIREDKFQRTNFLRKVTLP
jgi:hypothetical protein